MPYFSQFFIMLIFNIDLSKTFQINSFSFLCQVFEKVLTRKKVEWVVQSYLSIHSFLLKFAKEVEGEYSSPHYLGGDIPKPPGDAWNHDSTDPTYTIFFLYIKVCDKV